MSTIDWNTALESVNSDQQLLLEIIAILQQETPTLQSELQDAVTDRNADETRKAAHKLKGSVRFLGPNDVHTLAEQIELMDLEDFGNVDKVCADLFAAIENLSRELTAYVDAAKT